MATDTLERSILIDSHIILREMPELSAAAHKTRTGLFFLAISTHWVTYTFSIRLCRYDFGPIVDCLYPVARPMGRDDCHARLEPYVLCVAWTVHGKHTSLARYSLSKCDSQASPTILSPGGE